MVDILPNARRETPCLRTRERHLRGPQSDITAAEAAAMAMKAFPGAPALREEEAEHTTGALNSDYTGTCRLGFTLILLTATFGDCLIRAHYKHQVTFARS